MTTEAQKTKGPFICSGCGKVLETKPGSGTKQIEMEVLKFGTVTEEHVVCSEPCRTRVRTGFELRYGIKKAEKPVNN